MADTKLSALTADATPTTDDLIYTVNDPNGTPASRKVTIANLDTVLSATSKTLTNKTIDADNNTLQNISAQKLQGSPLDSTVGSPSDGKILVYRSAGSDWVLEDKPAGGSNPAINDVTDITITSVADNEVLAYNSGTSEWINQTAAEAGLAAASHTHTLTDVTDSGDLAALDTVGTTQIDNGAVTYAKIQNVSATDRLLGRDTAGAGVVEELTPAAVRTMINVEDGADVTDTANVTSAGALMDSELTDIAAIKATSDAVAADLNTGTDTAKFVTPDALAGANIGIRYLSLTLNGTTALTTSDAAYIRIPAAFNGMNLVSVGAGVGTGSSGASSSGTPTFTVTNVTDSNSMLSTNLTVDANEYTSATAATAAVINTATDDVVTDDLIEVACTVEGTGVTYATITLGFQLP